MAVEDIAVTLREAGPLDVPVIAALHADCFADGRGGAVWSTGSIASILGLPGSFAYLAAARPGDESRQEPGLTTPEPVGFLLARNLVGEAEVLSLGVTSSWRRQGVARALLHAAMCRAEDSGAKRTLLEVAEDNLAARALYAAEGFAVMTRRPAYYRRPSGAAVTALVFERPLAG